MGCQKWDTAPKRAWADTKEWLFNRIWAWFLAFLVPGGGAAVAALFMPPTSSVPLAALYGFLGGVCGLILLFAVIYIVQFQLAPFKQRNEARFVIDNMNKLKPPPNRDALIRAMANAKVAATKLYENHYSSSLSDLLEAEHALDTEILIAGKNYAPMFTSFMNILNAPMLFKAFLGLAGKLKEEDLDDSFEYEDALEDTLNATIDVIDGKLDLSENLFSHGTYLDTLSKKLSDRIKEETQNSETQP